jgi:PST family polysaccharide transporter
VIEQAGVGDVLVQRGKFRLWAVPGFWLSLVLGTLSTSLILLSAPIATWIYGDGQLFWVLAVLAPSSIPNALSAVPKARLRMDLRFRAVAAVNFANIALQKVLTVVFASLGFGALSFVLPTTIAAFAIGGFLWWWIRPPWAFRPHPRRWRYLVSDSINLLVSDFGRVLMDQSDRLLMGLFLTKELVGLYTVGWLFSIQTIVLLTVNLTNILFPVFTKLNDQPDKQLRGFLKAQRLLAVFGVTGCLLQAATAEPFMRLMYPNSSWDASIVVIQLLSLGMATRMIAGSSFGLLKSQGRFTTILLVRWSFVAIQVVALTAVLAFGGAVAEVAVAVSVITSFLGPIVFRAAIRPYGAGWSEVAKVLIGPTLCGLFSVGIAWSISRVMAAHGYGHLLQLVEIVLVAGGLNLLLAWLWMRPVWDDFWARIRQLVSRRPTGVTDSPLTAID